MNGQTKKHHQEPLRGAIKQPTILVRFLPPRRGAWIRRLGDLAAAGALIAFTLPLMAIVAIAIKYESTGPVFDRQACIASGGRRFQMLKFRTTAHDPARPAWARKTTRVGEWLRYTRIELLPQLINVLCGEMSMIDRDLAAPSFLN